MTKNNYIFEYQEVVGKLNEMHEHINSLGKHSSDLENLKNNLSSLKVSNNEEVLIPLSSGVFFKGKVSDTSKIVMGVGSGVVVEKEFPDALKSVDKQIEEVKSVMTQMQINFNYLRAREAELKKLMGSANSGD